MKYFSEKDLEKLLRLVSQGNTLLFIGSGFSTFAYNLFDERMPTANQLANKIGELGKFDAENDLFFAVEKYTELYSKLDLITFLEKTFTSKSFEPILKDILKFNFRRIYTTNYDDVIEKVSNDLNIYRKSVDSETLPKDYFKHLNICVHINGYIKNLNETTFETSFKLSENSYLESDSFERSQWWYSFKKDLETSSAIVFVGYSLYDIEIKKILYNKNFIEKTYFITIENLLEKDVFKFKKFGKIINIGIEKFSSLLKNLTPINQNEELKVFEKYHLNEIEIDQKIEDMDIVNLLTRGLLDKNKLVQSLNDKKKFYVVKRNIVEKIIEKINEYNYIFINSEFGNGKSVLIEELKYYLYQSGYNIFELIDYELDFKKDIDLLNKLACDRKLIIVIDKYCDNLELIEYLKINNNSNIIVILSDRTSNHYHAKTKKFLNELKSYEFNIDLLTEEEIEEIIELIFHIGGWGRDSSNKNIIRNKFEERYKKQFSLLLLDVFNSEQIKKAIEELIKPFMKEKRVKKTFFAILLLNLIDIEITKYLIEEVSGTDLIMSIDENELFNNNFKIKSSLLSKFIISNYFTYSFVKEELLRIVEKAQDYKIYDEYWRKIERELLRFHFVEQIVSSQHKKIFLKQYFEELKSKNKLQWLKKEPHYWLQYAMGEMANKNLESANKKLETAYSLASGKSSEYDFSYIDNQQARLYILFALQENNGKKIFDFFQKANQILSIELSNRYNIKQIIMYKKLYEEKFRFLSKEEKKAFLNNIREIYNEILKIKELGYEYSKCEISLKNILEKENLL